MPENSLGQFSPNVKYYFDNFMIEKALKSLWRYRDDVLFSLMLTSVGEISPERKAD